MPGQCGKAGATPLWATMPARRGRAQPKAKTTGQGGRGRGSAAAERSRSSSAGMTPPGSNSTWSTCRRLRRSAPIGGTG